MGGSKPIRNVLMHSERRLAGIFNHLPDATFVIDREGIVIAWNKAIEEMTGVKAERMLGKGDHEYALPFYGCRRPILIDTIFETDAALKDQYSFIKRDGNQTFAEVDLVMPGGRAITLWGKVSTLYDENGESIGAIESIRDITERKMADTALRENERFLDTIVENIPDMIFVKDSANLLFVRLNKAGEELLGYTLDELRGKSDYDFFPEKEADIFTRRDREVLHNNRMLDIPEEEILTKNKGHRFLHTKKIPILDETGGPKYLLGISEDITERKKAEDELSTLYRELEKRVTERTADLNTAQQELILKNEHLNDLNQQLTITRGELQLKINILNIRELELQETATSLKEALAEKNMLLSEIHHRVKNNLAAFISLLSLNGAYEETEANKDLRKDLQNRARSMVLIHETLYRTQNFSTVDMEVYLTTLVGHIAASYAGSKGIRTVVDARGVVLDFSRAATAGLIISELITNSFKYAFPPAFDCLAVRGEPCTIRVTLSPQDGAYTLSVADNGRGLPAGLDPLVSKSLGLKLVHFLARHQLRAETCVIGDKGTEFVFRLDRIPGKP